MSGQQMQLENSVPSVMTTGLVERQRWSVGRLGATQVEYLYRVSVIYLDIEIVPFFTCFIHLFCLTFSDHPLQSNFHMKKVFCLLLWKQHGLN